MVDYHGSNATEEHQNIPKFLRYNTMESNEINVGVQLELYMDTSSH